MTGGAVAESCDPGHVEEFLTFQSVGTAELQHAPANGAGAQVDELRRGERNHFEKEENYSAPLRSRVTTVPSTLMQVSCLRRERGSQSAETNPLQPTLLQVAPSFPSKSVPGPVSTLLAVSHMAPAQAFVYHYHLPPLSQQLTVVPACVTHTISSFPAFILGLPLHSQPLSWPWPFLLLSLLTS